MFKDFDNGTNKQVTPTSNHDEKDPRLERGKENTRQLISEKNEAGSKGDERIRHFVDDLRVVEDTGCENEKEYHAKYLMSHWKYSTFSTHLNVGRMVYNFRTKGVNLPPEMDFTPKKNLMYSFSGFNAEDRLMYQIKVFEHARKHREIPDTDTINEAIEEISYKIDKSEELNALLNASVESRKHIEQKIDNIREKLPPAITEVIDSASDKGLLKEGFLSDILFSLSQIDHFHTLESDLEEMLDAQYQCAKALIKSLDYDLLDEDEKDSVSNQMFKYALKQNSLAHNERTTRRLKKRIKKLI